MAEKVIDVRSLAPPQRHPLIFGTYDALAAGESFFLVNDHDPKPLYYQFMAEHPGEVGWQPQETGPERWVIRITRLAR